MTAWEDASSRLGRNELPAALFHTWAEGGFEGNDAELAQAISRTWTMCEWPERAASRELWLDIFSDAIGRRRREHLARAG